MLPWTELEKESRSNFLGLCLLVKEKRERILKCQPHTLARTVHVYHIYYTFTRPCVRVRVFAFTNCVDDGWWIYVYVYVYEYESAEHRHPPYMCGIR